MEEGQKWKTKIVGHQPVVKDDLDLDLYRKLPKLEFDTEEPIIDNLSMGGQQ